MLRYPDQDILTAVSKRRLELVKRKTLVLDMDETLIKSHIIYHTKKWYESPFVYDFRFSIPNTTGIVYVNKRPHVDFFLDRVAAWYDLIVFTAASKDYASRVLDLLDAGRNILNRRYYRQHCIPICHLPTKFLSTCVKDLSNALLLDDCELSIYMNPENSVQIKKYSNNIYDKELLCMLPLLDALRFTKDVRSIIKRREN